MNREYFLKAGKLGCLLIHDFTGTPANMRPLGNYLHERGFTVLGVCLKGHGTSLEDMLKCSWRDWLWDAREAFQRLKDECKAVSVIGLSMGGVLALILAEQYEVASCITLGTPMKLINKTSYFVPFISPFVPKIRPWIKKADAPNDITYDVLSEYAIGYDGLPVPKIYDLMKLMRTARKNLYSITAPTLIVQSENDGTVHFSSVNTIYSGISSFIKEKLILKSSKHVVTLGPERDMINETIVKFINVNVNA